MTPREAYMHAARTGRRCPEGEDIIATDPYWAFWYAQRIIKGRFFAGEDTIMRSSYRLWYIVEFMPPKETTNWKKEGF